MKKRNLFKLVLVVIVGATVFSRIKAEKSDDSNRAPAATLPMAAVAPQSPVIVAVKAKNPHEKQWNEFKAKYGQDLEAQFLIDGRIASIHGLPGRGNRAGAGFSPDDPQKAIARAREILNAAKEMIHISASSPLANPIARAAADSAQVFFHETHDGLDVAPFGDVKIDLGMQGELIGLDSNYYPDLSVTNDAKLNADEAKVKASLSIDDQKNVSSIHSEGGSQVLWVSGNEARHAYDYTVQGRQVIVDASDGRILYSRDRRHF